MRPMSDTILWLQPTPSCRVRIACKKALSIEKTRQSLQPVWAFWLTMAAILIFPNNRIQAELHLLHRQNYTATSAVTEMKGPWDSSDAGLQEEQDFCSYSSSVTGQVAGNVRPLGTFQLPLEFISVIRQTMMEEIKIFSDSGMIHKECKKTQMSGRLQPYSSSSPS